MIFPSGHIKQMKRQMFTQAQSALDGISDSAVDSFRASPLTEKIVGADDRLSNSGDNNKNEFLNISNTDTDNKNNNKDNEQSSSENSIRGFLLRKLESIGVPSRQLQQYLDKILEVTTDLNSGHMKGFYLIPTFTSTKEITEKDARNIASEIGSKFGLDQKMKISGNNYRIEFSSKVVSSPVNQHGTSFDTLGGDHGSSKTANSQSLEYMLRQSRENYFDKIIKKSIGDNK